jgi:hypothetical protein
MRGQSLAGSCFVLIVLTRPLAAVPLPERWCPLEVSLTIDRSEYFIGEPIIARMTLTNRSKETLRVPWPPRDYSFEHARDGGEFVSHGNGIVICYAGPPPLHALLPGQALSKWVDVSGHETIPIQPGRYAMRMRANTGYCRHSPEDAVFHTLISDSATFEIVTPTGAEAEAYRLIESWVKTRVPGSDCGMARAEREEFARRREAELGAWRYAANGPWVCIRDETCAVRYQAAVHAAYDPECAYDSPGTSEHGKAIAAFHAMRFARCDRSDADHARTRRWAVLIVRDYPDSVEALEARQVLYDLDCTRPPAVPPPDRTILARR